MILKLNHFRPGVFAPYFYNYIIKVIGIVNVVLPSVYYYRVCLVCDPTLDILHST